MEFSQKVDKYANVSKFMLLIRNSAVELMNGMGDCYYYNVVCIYLRVDQ